MASLDLLTGSEVIGLLLAGEARVVPAISAHIQTLDRAASLIADRLATGGSLLLIGAGTSGRIAVGEAVELPGTFGVDPATVLGRIAGGSIGGDGDEDDAAAGRREVAKLAIGSNDVIVAVAASGRTPYTLAAAKAARAAGAGVIAVTNTPGAELSDLADVAIEVPVGDEVLRGSTRMNAGTAQKIVLNVITTAAMVRLGRVHGDLMVDVVPANLKLRERVCGIVAEIAGRSAADAEQALQACGWNARAATVHLVTGSDPSAAVETVGRHRTLREALAAASPGAG